MSEITATRRSAIRIRSEKPRKRGNRRPVEKRLDLTPEQVDAKQAERAARQRTKAIHVQLTAAERTVIETRAAAYGMRLSDFVRTVMLSELKAPIPAKTDPAAIRALVWELSKVGTNLNQLAKRANEAAKIGGEKELAVLMAMEAEVRAVVGRIADTMMHVIAL